MNRRIERNKNIKQTPRWKRIVLGDDRDDQHKEDDILLEDLTDGIQEVIKTIKMAAVTVTTIFIMIYTIQQVLNGKSPYAQLEEKSPIDAIVGTEITVDTITEVDTGEIQIDGTQVELNR